MIRVDFLINDEHGHFTGRCCGVSFSDGHGDDYLELEGDLFTVRDNPRFRWIELPQLKEWQKHSRADRGIKLGREMYACTGWASGGNWCWEGTSMASVDALRLANNLRTFKHWSVNGGDSDLFDLWKAGPISVADWQKGTAAR